MAATDTAFCFDLDGTVTSVELLPRIAAAVGLQEEIEALTLATMQGVIPFQQSFKLRVRLLSSIPIAKVQEIVADAPIFEKVAAFIAERPQHCYIVTGNLDVWIASLVKRLGCTIFSAKADTCDEHIAQIGQLMDKGVAVASLKKNYGRIVVVGDGMNDVPMFEQGDVRIAYGAVHEPAPALLKMSDYVTYHEDGLCQLLRTLS